MIRTSSGKLYHAPAPAGDYRDCMACAAPAQVTLYPVETGAMPRVLCDPCYASLLSHPDTSTVVLLGGVS